MFWSFILQCRLSEVCSEEGEEEMLRMPEEYLSHIFFFSTLQKAYTSEGKQREVLSLCTNEKTYVVWRGMFVLPGHLGSLALK